jgi:hypothetical protein
MTTSLLPLLVVVYCAAPHLSATTTAFVLPYDSERWTSFPPYYTYGIEGVDI